MAGRKLLCVSVDLDGPGCYHEIHGLGEPDASLADAHYSSGLARLLDVFDEAGVRATLFAIGRDVERPGCAQVLADALDRGHEVGNHTRSHPYAFSRLDEHSIRDEIEGGAESIRKATGRPPVGFRAPGYHLSDTIARILEDLGYAYDASLLPSPAYYLAKVGVMAWMRLGGRTSRSVAGHPGMVAAPNRPYRMGASYWREGDGLPELPCTVLPLVRIPFIGTALSLSGEARSAWMARFASRLDFVGLELHAIDMMDAGTDGLDALREHQPDVRVPLARKRNTLARVLGILVGSGLEPVTLAEAAGRLFPDQV